MKFPSVQSLVDALVKVVARFPFETLCALLAAVTGWEMVYLDDTSISLVEQRLLMSANLGLVLFLSTSLYAESKAYRRGQKLFLRMVVLGILTTLFFVLQLQIGKADYLRFILLSSVFHVSVSFSPFLGRGRLKGFWTFNKTLFLRILTAILYSTVLYAGLALALLSIHYLFRAEFSEKYYVYLWIGIASIFNTLFFLAGVPDVVNELEEEQTSYPRGLKVFTQYVLIPLVTIYSVILLVYAIKILIYWNLPQGWVSVLILAYAIIGILSLLLIHPVRRQAENQWMRFFSRYFYLALIPLLGLFWLAIYTRINQYGITEERYILIVTAIWLSFICVWNVVTDGENIKVIPISLAAVFALTIFGPQSAFTISRLSQLNRLKKLIQQGKADQVYNVVDYLGREHGVAVLQPFVKENIEEIKNKLRKQNKGNRLTEKEEYTNTDALDSVKRLIKVKNSITNKETSIADGNMDRNYEDFERKDQEIIPIPADYSFLSLYSGKTLEYEPLKLTVRAEELERKNSYDDVIAVKIGKDSTKIELSSLVKRLLDKKSVKDSVPTHDMIIEQNLGIWKITVVFDNISLSRAGSNPYDVTYQKFNLLLKKKPE